MFVYMCCVLDTANAGDKMDFLKVGGRGGDDSKNIEANQLTVTSAISGNLALYEV